MTYKILISDDAPSADEAATLLEKMVNAYLQKGWKMYGGVSLTYNTTDESYAMAQAMIKEKKK